VAILNCEAAINQDIKCFDSGNDDSNIWLALALRASAKDILALNREGTTVQSVKYETLKKFLLPIPPIAEQREAVRRVENLFALADQIEARYAKAKVCVEKLTHSLLACAFRGELVTQDPNDEPASVLLDRIRQTQPNNQPKRKNKRGALAAIE
jgi:type I restriction enzyme S subunit